MRIRITNYVLRNFINVNTTINCIKAGSTVNVDFNNTLEL